MIAPLDLPAVVGEQALTLTWSWEPTDPAAVRFYVEQPWGAVDWIFARTLLSAAWAVGEAGRGDVRLYATPGGHTSMHLTSPEGEAVVEFDTDPLRDWLAKTYAAVEHDTSDGSPEALVYLEHIDALIADADAGAGGSDGWDQPIPWELP